MDPSKYMEMMQRVMGNPQFMGMAEQLGKQIMQVRPRGTGPTAGTQHHRYDTQHARNSVRPTSPAPPPSLCNFFVLEHCFVTLVIARRSLFFWNGLLNFY